MSNIWIPKEKIIEVYGDTFKDVRVGEVYLAPSNGAPGDFLGLGGDFQIDLKDLEQQFIDSYLTNVGALDDLAIRFSVTKEKPIILENELGKYISFRQIIGLVHPFGENSATIEDQDKLGRAAEQIDGIKQMHYAFFRPYPEQSSRPGVVRYESTMVSNLPDLIE